MSVPDFQSFMLPLLRLASDGAEHSIREARDWIASEFGLTQAELVDAPRRGYFRITPRGQEVLAGNPSHIDIRFLERFPSFVEFRSASARKAAETRKARAIDPAEGETPEEALERAYQTLREQLAAELLDRVKQGSPQAFEQLVVELLLRMGYGGSRREAGEAIGRGGDEGIDGIIREDRLGLDVVYLQAKRWQGTVGRPEIQKFVGALHGKRARKGVFITTGTFSADAVEYVSHIDPRVVLIDGDTLAELLIDHDLGVTRVASYELKRVDSDYFAEE